MIKNRTIISLAILVMLLLCPFCSARAEESFIADEDNVYHIRNIDDWYKFIDESQKGNTFADCTINLENDLTINATEYDAFQTFSGKFDGNGHEIVYSNSNITTNSAIFPIYLRSGIICNLNVKVEKCLLDASKNDHKATNGSILYYAGGARKKRGTLEKISIYGDINVVLNDSQNNDIACNGLNVSNCTVSDCVVNLNYNLDSNSLEEFLKNDSNYSLKLQLFQYGFKNSENVIYQNCYALGGYTESFVIASEHFEEHYKKDIDANDFTLITAFAGMPAGVTPSSQENCYYNSELKPVYLIGCDDAKAYATDCFLDDDSMKKTTEELKKQETFVDYDFENIWGISEYINEGYPYLRALVSKDLVALVDQIVALPKEDEITKDNKEAVEKIKEALAGLSDKDKALIPFDTFTDKVTKAEEAIKAIEEKEKEDGKTQPQEPTTISVKKGTKFTVKGYKYTVTGTSIKNPTVSITGYKNKKLKKISIPATVTYQKVVFKVNAIGNNAFKGQKKATAVIVGKNIASIGKASFAGDAKVKKITVKSVVLKKVGAKAFKGIHKKAVIKVPKKQVKAYKKLMKNKGQAKTVKIK